MAATEHEFTTPSRLPGTEGILLQLDLSAEDRQVVAEGLKRVADRLSGKRLKPWKAELLTLESLFKTNVTSLSLSDAWSVLSALQMVSDVSAELERLTWYFATLVIARLPVERGAGETSWK